MAVTLTLTLNHETLDRVNLTLNPIHARAEGVSVNLNQSHARADGVNHENDSESESDSSHFVTQGHANPIVC